MSNEYQRNHYIPEYYLRNFTNVDNFFYVYDKKAKYKNVLRKSPKNICFEWDRYTMYFNNEPYKELEKNTYGYFDNKHSKIFKLLSQARQKGFDWNMEAIETVEMFVPLTYWRSPISDKELLERIKDTNFIKETGLIMSDENGTNIEWTDDFTKTFLDDENIRKAIRPTLAYASLREPLRKTKHLEWRILFNTKKPNLTSDNPIIFREKPKSKEDFRDVIILPISNDTILTRIDERIEQTNLHEAFLQDIMIFHQAESYVICSDKNYLEDIAKEYRVFQKLGLINNVKDWLFQKYKNLPSL